MNKYIGENRLTYLWGKIKAFVSNAISGKVDKVSSSTDNAVVRFDGASGDIQNSGVTINDSNHLTAAKLITSGGTSSQFVKGDGSLDSNTYVKTSDLKVTTNTNIGIDAPGTNTIGYVSGLTRADWNYQQVDGSLYTQFYNSNWINEIFQDFRTGQLSIRSKNHDTWQPWRRVLDETNATTILGLNTYAPLASPALTGTPTAPTAASGTNTTQIATTEFTQAAIQNEAAARITADALLQQQYNALTQSDMIVGALPDTGVSNVIYRVPGTTDFSDYMWYNGQFVLMATYGLPISAEFVVDNNLNKTQEEVNELAAGVFDISVANAIEGTSATYTDLAAALGNNGENVPQDFRKGGMSVKFIQTSDNKYVQYIYTGIAVTGSPNPFLDTANWQCENEAYETAKRLDGQINGSIKYKYEEKTNLTANRYFNTENSPLSSAPSSSEAPGIYCIAIHVIPGEKYIITGYGGNKYSRLYSTADSDRYGVRFASENENTRSIPKEITIEEGEAYLYVNLTSYDSSIDKVEKAIPVSVPGLEDRVEELESDVHGTNLEEYNDLDISTWYSGYRYTTQDDPMQSTFVTSEGIVCNRLKVTAGEKYKIYGLGGNKYSLLYVITNSSLYKTRKAGLNENCRVNPKELTIEEGEAYLYVNLTSYDSTTDKVQKALEIHTPGLEDRVEDLEEVINNKIVVSVPDTIYAVVGDTLQLYYESMFRCVNWKDYDVYINCAIGAAYPRYYELTPTNSHIGNHTITIEIRDSQKRVLGTKQCTIVVKAAASSPSSNLNVLCVGASVTESGQWASELKRRLTMNGGTPAGNNFSNITFVGRKEPEYLGITVNLEATGGFSWNNYLDVSIRFHVFYFTQASPAGTVNVGDVYSFNSHNYTVSEINLTDGIGNISCTCDESGDVDVSGAGILTRVSGTGSETLSFPSSRSLGNPFAYNGIVDLQQYADDYCNGTIDVVCTELFGNGTEAYLDDVSGRIQQMQNFITMVRNVFPNCKFLIGMLYVLDPNGGLGINYGATGGWSHHYGMKYTSCNYMTALQKYINDNNMSDYVFIMDWLTEFDSEYDFRTTTKVVNPRSTKTETFGVNGAHPAQAGYFQMADTAWRLFVSKFCQ